MTVKLTGTTGGDVIADLSARLFRTHFLLHDLATQINKVKGDTDGALVILEGRIHALENVPPTPEPPPQPEDKPTKKAKS